MSAPIPAGIWTIDPSHSEVGFVVRHLMFSKVRGSFKDVSGTITVGENPLDSRAEATIAMSSIDTRDENRDNHLRSNDFFDIENFPAMTFASTVLKEDGKGGYVAEGDLTIKGITKSVSLTVEPLGAATDPFGNHKAGFSATTTINRKDFGVNWNAPLEAGGVLVGEDVTINLEIQAVKQA